MKSQAALIGTHLRKALGHHHVTLEQLFSMMDADRSNSISVKEFLRGVHMAGIRGTTAGELEALFKSMDADGSHLISLEELRDAMAHTSQLGGPGKVTEAPRDPLLEELASIEATLSGIMAEVGHVGSEVDRFEKGMDRLVATERCGHRETTRIEVTSTPEVIQHIKEEVCSGRAPRGPLPPTLARR